MYKLLFFVFKRMSPLPTYLSMEGKDQNAVVRLKDFQKVSGLILNKSLKVFRYQREKTRPIQPQVHHVRTASTC